MSDIGGGNAVKHPSSMTAHWPGLLVQVGLSSSRMLGWGMFMGFLGALVAGVSIAAHAAAVSVLAAIAALAGWICVAVGVTRLAAKADSAYALWVRTQYRQHLRENPEAVLSPKSN